MRKIITIVLSSIATGAMAQTGGSHVFDFLQLPAHARLAALGGVNVSLADKDVNLFQSNPALVGDTLSGFASAGYQFYLADVGNALFSAAYDFGQLGQLLLGIHHIRYGSIHGFDESGLETLDAAASETAILIGKNHQVGHMRFGVTLKGVFSNMAGYRASALMLDLGGIFRHPEHDLAVGLAIKNIGVVLSQYTPGRRPALPFDVQAGITLKPLYMPLRFSLTAYHLTEADLLGAGSTTDAERSARLKNIFCHLDLGAEILVHRNVNVMLGYNYLLRQALKMETGVSAAGFAYGFSIIAKPVEFVFSRSSYVTGNAGYSFTLSTNVNQLLKKVKL